MITLPRSPQGWSKKTRGQRSGGAPSLCHPHALSHALSPHLTPGGAGPLAAAAGPIPRTPAAVPPPPPAPAAPPRSTPAAGEARRQGPVGSTHTPAIPGKAQREGAARRETMRGSGRWRLLLCPRPGLSPALLVLPGRRGEGGKGRAMAWVAARAGRLPRARLPQKWAGHDTPTPITKEMTVIK